MSTSSCGSSASSPVSGGDCAGGGGKLPGNHEDYNWSAIDTVRSHARLVAHATRSSYAMATSRPTGLKASLWATSSSVASGQTCSGRNGEAFTAAVARFMLLPLGIAKPAESKEQSKRSFPPH